MSRPTHIAKTLLAALLLCGPGASLARAADPAPLVSPQVAALEAECARLRTALAQANAEVTSLKRRERGVGDDYRLRQKMADAEALARKLTDAEAKLRQLRGPGPAPARPSPVPAPSAAPHDGPIELEAKADLLTDESRRLAAEADRLTRVAETARRKDLLRRRAGALESDPFAGMDGPKRNVVLRSTRAAQDAPTGPTPLDTAEKGGSRGSATPMSSPTAPPTAPPSPPPTGSSSPTAAPPPAGGTPGAATATPPPPTPPATPEGQGANAPTSGGTAVAPGGPSSFTGGAQPTSAVSVSLRTWLDPATLAEIRKLELSGRPTADADAMEKAAAALRARSRHLQEQAGQLRTQARPQR